MSADEDTRAIPLTGDVAGMLPALIAALILEDVSPTTVERAVARARTLDMAPSLDMTALVRAFANEQAQRLASGPR